MNVCNNAPTTFSKIVKLALSFKASMIIFQIKLNKHNAMKPNKWKLLH